MCDGPREGVSDLVRRWTEKNIWLPTYLNVLQEYIILQIQTKVKIHSVHDHNIYIQYLIRAQSVAIAKSQREKVKFKENYAMLKILTENYYLRSLLPRVQVFECFVGLRD